MFTVALIGPDGAGKTTLCRALERRLPLPVKYIYMGVNAEASNLALPTTRLLWAFRRLRGREPDQGGPRDRAQPSRRPKGFLRRAAAGLKSGARLLHLVSEEWYRQTRARWYTRCGYVVVCDRHYFLDYYHYDVAPDAGERPLHRRVHGFLLSRFYPRPDMVILLDAPAALLYSRKAEGSVELLERRRRDYQQFQRVVEHFYVINAARGPQEVAEEAARIICEFGRRYGKKCAGQLDELDKPIVDVGADAPRSATRKRRVADTL